MRKTTTVVCSVLAMMGSSPCIAQGPEKLSLDGALRTALQQNTSILNARSEIEAADGRLLQAGAIPPPEVGIGWGEVPSGFNVSGYGERSIGISQAIEFPGKRGARQRAARQDLFIQRENLRRLERIVTAEVKQAYYRVVLHEELIATENEALKMLRQFQQTAKTRYETQTVPFLDVLRANLETTKAGNRLLELKLNLKKSTVELNRVIGRADTAEMKPADGMTYEPFTGSLEECLTRTDWPSMKIADALVERNRTLTSLAQKSFLPDFSVGLYNLTLREQPPFNANNFSGTTIKGSWQLDIRASIPLWFWKQQKGEVIAAQSNERIAVIARTSVERRLSSAVRTAHESLKTAESLVQTFQQSLLKDSRDALQSGITLYQNNRLDALNLLDIYRTHLETKSEYVTALYHYHVALANLESSGENAINWGAPNEN